MPEEEKNITEESKGESDATIEQKDTEQQEQQEETAEQIAEKANGKQESKTVGIDKFLDEKKGRKQAEKALKELQEKIAGGDATDDELSDDIADIAKEFPEINPRFLKLMEKMAERKAEKKMKPITEKEKQDNFDKIVEERFNTVLDSYPEFKGIANLSVIKALVKDPSNAHKKVSQIIEDTYGGLIQGRKTIESTKPNGGKEPAMLDYDRANKDATYFDEVMNNPKLKAEYNTEMLKRGF